MEKQWVYRPAPDPVVVSRLAAEVKVDGAVAALLASRGICTFDEAKHFFRPTLADLPDPYRMRDMDRAVQRLAAALESGEKIVVYGDYDVDGTTSVALFYGFLRRQYPAAPLHYYIPDRYAEGYGISRTGIEWAHREGVTLMVSLDCGIKSVELVGYAASLGIDFIICDHHLPGDTLPPAVAVLDPKRKDCEYPYKDLSGCGVGFKLLQALCRYYDQPEKDLYCCLDLLAVSIACDIVPMTGENRILAHFGLLQLNEYPSPGVKALIHIAGFKNELDTTNVVFGLGPRINAAGRIHHILKGRPLLTRGSRWAIPKPIASR